MTFRKCAEESPYQWQCHVYVQVYQMNTRLRKKEQQLVDKHIDNPKSTLYSKKIIYK